MAEDHGFQAAEGHRLCANNCGFFGSSATLNLCSKCYRDYCLKEEQAKSAKSAVENSLASSSTAVMPTAEVLAVPSPPKEEESVPVEVPAFVPAVQPNRCFRCRKRVGLAGFKCRCGVTCCGTHRYPEQHGCTFDYKAAGKEAIARENPVVKAQKLRKI